GDFELMVHNNQCGGPGGGVIPENADLFISNVYDASSGSLGYVEVFNGTLSDIDVSHYAIRIITTSTNTTYPMSGILPSGGSYILRIGNSDSECEDIETDIIVNLTGASGFNGNDEIFLLKNGVGLDY